MNIPAEFFYGLIISNIIFLLFIIGFLLIRRKGPSHTLDYVNAKLDKLEDISVRVENLSNIFFLPYARGDVGETLLEELLKNWLPKKQYAMQYTFRNGRQVDAIIRLGNYIVPIDAKFPLESIRSVLKGGGGKPSYSELRKTFLKLIKDIAKKYIRPEEGTLQFALMYIPSEKIYYHAFVEENSELMKDALTHGVVPVSPYNLFLYVQTIAYGLKGFQFPKRQKELVIQLQQLKQDFSEFQHSFHTASTHLKNLQKNHEEAFTKLNNLDILIGRMNDGD